MWLLLLTGCAANWYGSWDFDRFELSAPDAELIHGDMGWIECDDQLECQLLRRYDVDMQTLTVVPLSQVGVEFASVEEKDSVVWSWGGAMQLQLDVTASTQTSLQLEGTAVVLEPSPYQSLDVRMELVR